METMTINIYQFDELNDKAQETALNWMRSTEEESIYLDESVCDALDASLKEDAPGLEVSECCLNYSQGDGVKFEGEMDVRECGKFDEEVKQVSALLDEYDNQWTAIVIAEPDYLSNVTHVDVVIDAWCGDRVAAGPERYDALEKAVEEAAELLQKSAASFIADLSYEYRRMGYDQIDYLLSDEVLAETIRANEYWFTETGSRTVVL